MSKNILVVGGRVFFSFSKDGINYTEPFITDWSEYMLATDRSIGTIKKYANSIFRFWIYAFYHPAKEEEMFLKYILQYKDIIENKGFKIIEQIRIPALSASVHCTIYECPKQSIVTDLKALNSFFTYIQEFHKDDYKKLSNNFPIDFYYDKKDYKALRTRERYSKGAAYGLKAKDLMRESIAKRQNVFSNLLKNATKKASKSSIISDYKAMPIDMYDKLLQIAPNERKLLYLLVGAAPRLGQALSLTRFDIDMDLKRVFIVNPLSPAKQLPIDSNGYLFLEQPPRLELLKQFNSHPNVGHNKLIRHKQYLNFGEIPSIDDQDGYLFFLTDEYRNLFFSTYAKVVNLQSATQKAKNPYVFQTSTGKRLLPSEAYSGLKTDMKTLLKKYPHYKDVKLKGGFHKFRHMFGRTLASIAYIMQAEDEKWSNIDVAKTKKTNLVALMKSFTRAKMGHSSASSTIDNYFAPNAIVHSFVVNIIHEKSKPYLDLANKMSPKIEPVNFRF